MKQNRNSRRVNEQAREKLANILLFEVADPELSLVTLTGVEVSVDKSVLRAYVSCEADRYETVSQALERAKGRIRSLLGHALGWRVTPELIFQIDTTADEAERITRALQNVPPTIGVEKDENGYPVAAGDGAPASGADDAGAEGASGADGAAGAPAEGEDDEA
jgi:ribosome-binding factor A